MRSRDSVISNSLRLVDAEKGGEREAEIVWGVGHVPSSELGICGASSAPGFPPPPIDKAPAVEAIIHQKETKSRPRASKANPDLGQPRSISYLPRFQHGGRDGAKLSSLYPKVLRHRPPSRPSSPRTPHDLRLHHKTHFTPAERSSRWGVTWSAKWQRDYD